MSMKTAIDLEIELDGQEIELSFEMTDQLYIKHTNEIQLDDKYSPFHQLLVRAVVPDDEAKLLEILKNAPVALTLGSNLLNEFMPEIKVKVKKRKSAQTA